MELIMHEVELLYTYYIVHAFEAMDIREWIVFLLRFYKHPSPLLNTPP